ncbi:MAG: methyltransferase domain-containing protein [Rhodospirillaceae bacterium]|nr:methyltransferase domain-containing protein [Rhodospirillaceae bacterium]
MKLAERWPDRPVIGLDSSPSMLAAARKEFGDRGITWQDGDIAAWRATEPCALVFANAALHWVPDHPALFPRLMSNITPGGILAVQMPVTSQAQYHAGIAELLALPAWETRLAGIRSHDHPLTAGAYYDILKPLAGQIDIWETHYHHAMPDMAAVVNWTRGTALAPYLSALDPAGQQDFLAAYGRILAPAYAAQADGQILFTMRRIFIVARRA